jgi:hypothetical protein
MKSLILAFCILIPFCSFSQNDTESKKYIHESKIMLSQLLEKMKITATAILNDKATTQDLNDCFKTTFKDSEDLTEKEKKQLKKEIDNPCYFKWTNEYVDNVKIIKETELNKIFENRAEGWKNFREKYGKSIIRLSKPIFLRNYTICIISYSETFDYLGGYGETGCFRKINGKWVEFGNFCMWNS